MLICAAGVQLSLAVTPGTKFGVAAWPLPSAEAVTPAGQLAVGAVVSATVRVAVQALLFPAGSLTVTVTM
jgi:hypothetical protein